jgi:cation transport ATPase
LNKKQKKMLIRIIAAAVILIALMIIPVGDNKWLNLALYAVPYLIVGYDILKKAFKGILNRQVFDENFLMAVASLGAMALGNTGKPPQLYSFIRLASCFRAMLSAKAAKASARLWISAPITLILSVRASLKRWIPMRLKSAASSSFLRVKKFRLTAWLKAAPQVLTPLPSRVKAFRVTLQRGMRFSAAASI